MKTEITYKDLKAMRPCYKPEEIGITEGYIATIPEFIKEYRDKVKEKDDIIWALCRKRYITERDMRLFAVWCARECLKLIDNPDKRSVDACNIAERFANGEATQKELNAARVAAQVAARVAAWDATRDAAWDATRAAQVATRAAQVAAEAAAQVATEDATWGAARAATQNAAWVAAWVAVWGVARVTVQNAAWVAAWDATWDAIWDATQDAQIDKLLTYF